MIERAAETAVQPKPWHHNRWFWLVAAPPIAAVIGGLLTVVIAVRNADSLVVDDYARVGRAFDADRSRDRRARALGVTATLRVDRRDGAVELAVQSVPARTLDLKLIHPTDASGDRQISLSPDEQGRYVGNLGGLDTFRRQVEIASPEQGWRLRGKLPTAAGDVRLTPP